MELVRKAVRGISITCAGAQTSTTGASITDTGMLLSLRSLNRISAPDEKTRTIKVEPGALVGEIKRTAAAAGLLFAPDPTSEEESTIGGAIACNASGARTFKYGATRRHVRALKVVMAGFAVLWAARLVRGDGPPHPEGAAVLTVIFAAHAVLGDLSHGNVNIFIAFLVFAALELRRRGRPVAGGLTLALAVACKVTPALFLPYLVWKRAWRMVAGALAGCVLWFLVVPGAALGWGHNLDLLESWYGRMVKPFVIEGRVTSEHANQSIPGLTCRLLTNQPSALAYDEFDRKPHAVEFHNVADIGPDGAKWVVRGCQALFVLGAVGLCRTRAVTGRVYAAECGYVMLGMLLFSERTWKHHGVVLILPFAVLASVAFDRGARPWLRRSVVAVFAAVGVLILGPSLVGGEFQDLALTFGSHTAVFLILTAGILLVLAASRPVTPPAAGPSDAAAGTSIGPAESAGAG